MPALFLIYVLALVAAVGIGKAGYMRTMIAIWFPFLAPFLLINYTYHKLRDENTYLK